MAYRLIRTARKKAGLTQNDLAAALGVNRATISKYENGVIDLPTSQARQLAKILKVENWYELYPEEKQGDAIVEDVVDRAGLTVVDDNGIIIKQGDGKPFRKMSDSEMHKAGLLKFDSEEDRIAHFYSKLNTDGKLVASRCFYQHINPESLTEVADYVEKLSKTPQYQRTEQHEDPPNGE